MSFIVPFPGGSAVDIEYRDSVLDTTTNQLSHTFAAKNIGPASSARYVIAAIACASPPTVVTIGGVTATLLSIITTSGNTRLSLYIALVPTGTTAVVALTTTIGSAYWGLILWSMTGNASASPASTVTSTANPTPIASMSCNAGGAILGCAAAFILSGATPTNSWSGISRDADVPIPTFGRDLTGAHTNFSAAQSGHSCSVTFAGGTINSSGAIFVAFNPP